MATGKGGAVPPPEVDVVLFQRLLQERAERAHALISRLSNEIREVTLSQRDTPADDEHDPEGSTITLEREHDVALLASVEAQLFELDAAKKRLAAGTYGICERCGKPIPKERLEARPEVRLCVPCVSLRAR